MRAGVQQDEQILIKGGIRKERGPGGIQPIVDHIIPQPLAHVTVQMRIELAIGLPKAVQRIKSLLRRPDADLVEELIDIQKSKGEGGFGDLSAAHGGPPGEIPAQLGVIHGLIGGVIARELPTVGAVVLKVLHQLPLLVKDPLRGLVVRLPAAGDLFHPMVLGRQVIGHLCRCVEDRLVPVNLCLKILPLL